MKKFLILLLVITGWKFSYAQSESSVSRLTIEDVPLAAEMSHVFYSDVPLKEKFGNAKSWVAKTFGEYNSAIQLEDAENNRIIIKGGTPVEYRHEQHKGKYEETTFTMHFAENYTFTMTIDIKDDRFRIKFENISIMVASESEKGLHPQKQIVPNTKVSINDRFGADFSPEEDSTSAMKIRNAFLELFNSASLAISTRDVF